MMRFFAGEAARTDQVCVGGGLLSMKNDDLFKGF
jgi:hypothetical protein